MPKVRPVKVDPKFKDRIYLLINAQDLPGKASHAVWNNPMGGALEWNFNPQIGIVDTKGDYRWYLFTNPIYSLDSLYYGGDMMGFRQNKDSAFTWGYGQRYVKYDLMGLEIWNRRLPFSYNDFSHPLDPAQHGHFFLRVASSNVRLANGENVRTVSDVIAEVDHDATSSTNSVSSTSSTPIARTSSRPSTRVRRASTLLIPRPARRSPKKTSRS